MKLSIITVNLNNKDGLQKTIDSVISQTFKDFEWIVIDGGSTDGSKELIEKYSDYISYWVSEPDKGIYNAMNKGIRIAKGEYIEFLNSGDIYYNDRSLSDFFSMAKDKDIIFGSTVILKDGKYRRINLQNDFLSCYHLTKNTLNHQSAFIKRNLFSEHGFYDESLRIVSDWKFFFEMIVINKCSLYYIDKDIVIYDTNGLSSINVEKRKQERLAVLKHYLPDYAIDDYISRFEMNELLNHPFTKLLVGLLYRIAVWLEKKHFINQSIC